MGLKGLHGVTCSCKSAAGGPTVLRSCAPAGNQQDSCTVTVKIL